MAARHCAVTVLWFAVLHSVFGLSLVFVRLLDTYLGT